MKDYMYNLNYVQKKQNLKKTWVSEIAIDEVKNQIIYTICLGGPIKVIQSYLNKNLIMQD